MEQCYNYLLHNSQQLFALLNKYGLELTGVVFTAALVGLAYAFLYRGRKAGMPQPVEKRGLIPAISLSEQDKGILSDAITLGVEEKVIRKEITRRKARQIYNKAARIYSLPELVFVGNDKQLKRERIRLLRAQKPANIPGPKPVQDIKPSVPVVKQKEVKLTAKERFASFKTRPAAL